MVDLCRIIVRYYFDPLTGGSNSIKKILPGILNQSPFLQEKYSKPIYGACNGIKSHNYSDWAWINFQNGKVLDPYKLLLNGYDDLISIDDQVADGGEAMNAYAKMQYDDLSEDEFIALKKALLKYCELDTLAMVMIYEGLKGFI